MARFVVFLGAGASDPFGIPTMTRMAEELETNLKSTYSVHLKLFNDIKYCLKNYQYFDIEAVITVLQDIIDIDKVPTMVLNQPSVHYFSTWGLSFEKMVEVNRENALRNRESAGQLLKEVKAFVAESCVIQEQPFEIYDEFFHQVMFKHGYDFRQALDGEGQKHINCVIFTTNYDQVIEAYCHARHLDYECGEAQNLELDITNSNNRLYLLDVPVFQIHKLHGSVNWYVDQTGAKRWLTEPAQPGRTTSLGDTVARELLIYPAFDKYTFREPFYTMFHHLKESLLSCEACYVVGYSFRDDDILGLFHDAMELNEEWLLFLLDKNANAIIEKRFEPFSKRVQPLPMEFSAQAVRNLA